MEHTNDASIEAFRREAERWRQAMLRRIATFPSSSQSDRWLGLARTFNRTHQDPEEHKILKRTFKNLLELERLEDRGDLKKDGRSAVLRILKTGDPETLHLDEGLQVLDALDRVLVEYADEDYLCRRTELAMSKEEGTTTLLTWDQLYGQETPPALKSCRAGENVDQQDLISLRNKLAGLLHARSDLYAIHKARLRMKKRLMLMVAWVLAVLALGFAVAIALQPEGLLGRVILMALAGGIGATLSGAIKLRDTLELGSELREFSTAVVLQPVIGAIFALVVLVLLEGGLITTAASGWAEGVVLGFLAGFSEPFALGLVTRFTQ